LRLPLPDTATEAYEALRQQVVGPDRQIAHAEGRGVLFRCGLAKWAQVQSTPAMAPPPGSRPWQDQPAIPPPAETELVKLVASLILSIRQEVTHA
jgi:hypothetical protein